jgi:hypothetical protein
MQQTTISFLLAAVLCSGIAWSIAGCEQKGPAQRTGEQIDRSVEKMKDAVNPPGPAEKAGRAVDRAVDDATR